MKTSQDRILTTHVGSLPRSDTVVDLLTRRENGEPAPAFDDVVRDAVATIVRRQVDLGIDVVSDGEMGKISYATYVAERLSGFGGDTPREPGQDLVEFPALLKKLAERGSTAKYRRPRCVGEVRVKNLAPLSTDLQNLAARDHMFPSACSGGVAAGSPTRTCATP